MSTVSTFAIGTANPKAKLPPNTTTVNGWILDSQENMPLEQFLNFTPKKFKEERGKKLSLKDKLALKFIQKNLSHTVKNGTNLPVSFDLAQEARKFKIGGFLLGFFLGILGLLISLFFKDKDTRRSVLYGFGVQLILGIILILLM